MLKNNFAEFKKLKSYKLLRLFYIVLCFWAIWINFRWIFVESRRNVGVTASMMDVATFKIAVVTYPLLFVLLLVVLRILTINYLYTKNINKVKIAIVILLISGFALGFTHAYLSDRLDSFFNAYYDQEERIYQECRQKYQSDAAPDSTSTDWGLAGDPCVSFGKPVIYFYPEKTLDIFVKPNKRTPN